VLASGACHVPEANLDGAPTTRRWKSWPVARNAHVSLPMPDPAGRRGRGERELAADVGPTGSGDTSIWVAVYLGDDTTSPIYAYSTLAASSTTANMGTVRMGKVSNSGTWGTMYIDDLVVQSDVTTIGPANTASSNWFYV